MEKLLESIIQFFTFISTITPDYLVEHFFFNWSVNIWIDGISLILFPFNYFSARWKEINNGKMTFGILAFYLLPFFNLIFLALNLFSINWSYLFHAIGKVALSIWMVLKPIWSPIHYLLIRTAPYNLYMRYKETENDVLSFMADVNEEAETTASENLEAASSSLQDAVSQLDPITED